MIIVMKPEATQATVDQLLGRISAKELTPLHMPGSERVMLDELALEADPSVESVKLAAHQFVEGEASGSEVRLLDQYIEASHG